MVFLFQINLYLCDMVVDLNKKIKVKLKYLVPKEEQVGIKNFDMYENIETDVYVRDFMDRVAMTPQEYLKLENESIAKNNEKFTKEINFNQQTKINYNQPTVYKSHFQKVFDLTDAAIFN